MVVPWGLSVFARSGSTWIRGWSPESSAKASMSAWVIVRHSLGPTSWPTSARIPSTPSTSVAIGAQSIPASVAPPAGNDLAVTVAARPEGDHLEALVAGFEGAGHLRGDADRIEPLDLDDLVVEFEQPTAANDDVDLLRLLVDVAEGLPFPRLEPVEAEAGVLGLDVVLGEPCLHVVAEAETGCRVFDLVQLLVGEGVAHDAPLVAAVAATLPAGSGAKQFDLRGQLALEENVEGEARRTHVSEVVVVEVRRLEGRQGLEVGAGRRED